MKWHYLPLASLLLASAAGANAASNDAAGGTMIMLYPEGALRPLPTPERVDQMGEMRIVRNVSAPSLEVFLPAPGKANGTSMIVAPGGGFMILSYDSEGVMVAKKLAERGVTAFVLKYRLKQTPDDPAAFQKEFAAFLADVQKNSASDHEIPVQKSLEENAAQDAQKAIRYVRDRAGEWGLDPHRIGMIGFSAGAFTTFNAAVGPKDSRPDFAAMIYGAGHGPVPADVPPAFIAGSSDDPLLPDRQVPVYMAWRAVKRPVEFHMFERGGHGYGAVPQGATSDHWMDEFLWWLEDHKLLSPEQAEGANGLRREGG